MNDLVVLLGVAGLAVLYPLGMRWMRRPLRARLEKLYPQLELTGVTWEEGWKALTLVGWKDDTVVALAGRASGSVEVRVGIDATLPPGLNLTPQTRDVRLEGLQDIQVGVPDLDARFQIQAENPAAAIRYMRDERTQQALRAVLEADPKAAVIGGEIRLSVPRSSDVELLRRKVQTAIRSARSLSEAGEPASGERPRASEGHEGLLQPQGQPPASPRPAPGPTAPAARTVKLPDLPRFSAGYVHRMRTIYQRRSLMIWGLYGIIAAIFLLPVTEAQRIPLGPLEPLAAFLLEWDISIFVVLVGCMVLRAILYRCPACSTALPEFKPKVSEFELLFRRRRVKCEHCGIQLQ